MTPTHPYYHTLEDLLKDHATPVEMAEDLDYSMLSLVLLMRYEPGRITRMIESYESLWELRNLILSKIKN